MEVNIQRLKESFSGKSVKISDCQAFSPFKTLPGSAGHLAFRHGDYDSLVFDDLLERGYFGQPTETSPNASLMLLFGQRMLCRLSP